MNIQLCYSSKRVDRGLDLIAELTQILQTAHEFNAKHQIYGVLYYADGAFFQCLEGEQAALEALYQRIQADPRHHQIHTFPIREVTELHFKKWSMKFVKSHTRISKFFNRLGYSTFEITALDTENFDEFLKLLLKVDGVKL